jgi:hypothetical protein
MQALTLPAFALAAVSLSALPSLANTAFVSNENGNSVSVIDCAARCFSRARSSPAIPRAAC